MTTPREHPQLIYVEVAYCPFCRKHVWGEGSNPKTGARYFSHVEDGDCYEEIGLILTLHPESTRR